MVMEMVMIIVIHLLVLMMTTTNNRPEFGLEPVRVERGDVRVDGLCHIISYDFMLDSITTYYVSLYYIALYIIFYHIIRCLAGRVVVLLLLPVPEELDVAPILTICYGTIYDNLIVRSCNIR